MLPRLLLMFAALPLWAQQPFPVALLGEIGRTGSDFDEQEYADLGPIRVFPESPETLRVEGHDAQGRPWRVWLPRFGMGETRVFEADFDANGRPDLLFDAPYMANGRCAVVASIVTLLFDDDGRPVPWRDSTYGRTGDDSVPITILDLDVDRKAELVTVDCRQSGFDENIGIGGVFEAREARWIPVQPDSLDPYLAAANRRLADLGLEYVEQISPPDGASVDPLEGWDSRPEVRLTGLLTGEMGCPWSAGRADPDSVLEEDCDETAGRDRIRTSDGRLLAVWPVTVIDSPAGREIDFADSRDSLERILASGSPMRLLGPSATPEFVWARGGAIAGAEALVARLSISAVRRTALELTDELPPPVPPEPKARPQADSDSPIAAAILGFPAGGGSGTGLGLIVRRMPPFLSGVVGAGREVFSREGRCFFLPPATAEERLVQSLPSCSELGDLQSAADDGARVWIDSETAIRVVYATDRVLRTGLGALIGSQRVIQFGPAADRPGDVVGAIRFDPGWLVQWSRGAESWLALHSQEGEPISSPIRLDIEGELFRRDRSEGLTFLRWEDGVPVELIAVRAAIEWTRAE